MNLQFPPFNFFSLGFMNTRLQEKSSYVGEDIIYTTFKETR